MNTTCKKCGFTMDEPAKFGTNADGSQNSDYCCYCFKDGQLDNTPICQSCGMPMDEPEKFGTNADGSKNEDYCCHCFVKSAFTQDITLDEAIEQNIPFLLEYDVVKTEDEARAMLKDFMPKLKRWVKA